MKKLLLFCCLITTVTQAQDYWIEFSTGQPIANTGINSISIVNDSNTWINMSCGTLTCTPIRRYAVTTDGGTIWQTGEVDLGADSEHLVISTISGVSPSVAYVAAHPIAANIDGGIWKTADGGTTWTRQSTAAFADPESFPGWVHFWNANEGVTAGDPTNGYFEIYVTSDGGNLWTRVPSSPALVPLALDEYLITNNFTITDNTLWAMTTYGRILKSTDKGMSWTISQSPITEFYYDIGFFVTVDMAFTDQDNGLLQTNDFRIYNTTDGGTTWNFLNYSGVARSFGIAAIPDIPNAYVAVGEDYLNHVRGSSYSLDGGLTWIDINNNSDSNYVNGGVIEMLNNNTGFASGFSTSPTVGGIFKWSINNCICAGTSDFYKDQLITASPNPTSGKVTLSGTGTTQIVVSDLMGKQISSTQYDAIDTKTVNLEALENGIYLLTVYSTQGTSFVKVVKQ